jgi:hypothetical protein
MSRAHDGAGGGDSHGLKDGWGEGPQEDLQKPNDAEDFTLATLLLVPDGRKEHAQPNKTKEQSSSVVLPCTVVCRQCHRCR